MKVIWWILGFVLFGWLAVLALAFFRHGAQKAAAKAAAPPPAPAAPPPLPPARASAGPVGDVIDGAANVVDGLAIKAAESIPGVGQVVKAADALLNAAPLPGPVKDFIRDPLTAQVKLAVAVAGPVVNAIGSAASAVGDAISGLFGGGGLSAAEQANNNAIEAQLRTVYTTPEALGAAHVAAIHGRTAAVAN